MRSGWKDLREDDEGGLWIGFTRHKGRDRHPTPPEIPRVAELRREIAGDPAAEASLVPKGYGKLFTGAGFGNRFRKGCDAAGLGRCSVHGLRKAAAARLAALDTREGGITAITGHQMPTDVTRVTGVRPRDVLPPSNRHGMTQPRGMPTPVPAFPTRPGTETALRRNRLEQIGGSP